MSKINNRKGKAKELAQSSMECEAYLDIASVGELHARLTSLITTKQAVTIDVSKVERIDTAALQTLSAFVKAAHENNIPFTWYEQPSQAFRNAAKLLGLTGILSLAD